MVAQLDILVLSPPGFPLPGIARAATRAGYGGGLDLQFASTTQQQALLRELSWTGRRYDIAIGAFDESVRDVIASYASSLRRIILTDPTAGSLTEHVAAIHGLGLEAFVTSSTLDRAKEAQAAGADGIILKGNEAGGYVGEETSFILLQRVRPVVSTPLWVQGGVGLYTSAACLAGGAKGVVLDWQLALAQEASLPPDVLAKLRRLDGSETAVVGQDLGLRLRAFAAPGEEGFSQLREYEARHVSGGAERCPDLAAWRKEIDSRMGDVPAGRLLAFGQDAAFAAPLAERFGTVAAICRAIQAEASRLCGVAAERPVLRENGPLAESHGTRYPVLQGPMTRVSDVADFALAVAEGGGLPFLALSLLRGPQVAALLEETKTKLGTRPWGIGILGFVPKELRDEQLAEVMRHPPPFALIAGGRPDQAAAFEKQGIHTYLHVPSPGLLRMFLEAGARRVIFEGRECGGHVGPRSSFVLWNAMIDVLLAHLADSTQPADSYHVVFAGGIHDRTSAAMVEALAAPLTERGVKIGVLMGTAYLFTKEAVDSGAIVPGFQQEALRCRQTILLETGVGHATRCADTPFGAQFAEAKAALLREGKSADEIREQLEQLNLGRLRIASKAVQRDESTPGQRCFVPLDEETQRREGMYMIGQVAALRDRCCTIAELHAEVAAGEEILAAFRAPRALRPMNAPADVAIIGMSCMLPKAGDKQRFWTNVLGKVNAIREVPPEQWDSALYFDEDRRARDQVYSRWGGFLDPVPFDPMKFGMPPNAVRSVEPVQLLVLEAVRAALADAGYANRPFDRAHTSVIIGAGGGVGNVGLGYGFRSMLPHYLALADGTKEDAARLIDRLGEHLPEWTEDSFAGLLLNVIAGRVANRFDFGGTNYTVDAACASSLAAVRLAVNELQSGSSNVVVVGGADTMQSPFAYLCFSKTQALSPTGQCRTFDESSDGIVISEGIVMLVLKRLEDAVRAGDRVYAVIRGVGSSSDGRDKGLTAPRPEGQMRALERAYAQAAVSPRSIGLIEAHGTGTVAGDKSEVESLTRMFRAAGAARQDCALGSVKSMIGHTKCTAGVAGLMKAALAVHHKVLPPTLGVKKPNPKANFAESPFYVNAEARPWLARPDGTPRRAGVSAFGFGGTNFHTVLEEYVPPQGAQAAGVEDWPAELFCWRGASVEAVQARAKVLADALAAGCAPRLADLAAAVHREDANSSGPGVLAIVAESLEALRERLNKALAVIASGATQHRDPAGIFFAADAPDARGVVAFLFPGQGSQRVNMLRDLAIALPLVREVFEQADAALGDALGAPLSHFVFPKPAFTDEERAAQEQALTNTRVAQPAIGAADLAMFALLAELGLPGDFFAGHSYGEYAALAAAGAMSLADLMRISEARGRLLGEAGEAAPGSMAALELDEQATRELLDGLEGVSIANLNSPAQTVITGTPPGVAAALERCKQRGKTGRPLRVSAAFHSPLMAPAQPRFAKELENIDLRPPRGAVFANLTARPHAADAGQIRQALVEHLTSPVRFTAEVEAMSEAGARVFVEVGPGRTLCGLVEKTLTGRPFATVALDQGSRHGLVQLLLGLGTLAMHGVRFDAGALFAGRISKAPSLASLLEAARPKPPSPTTWLLYGNKAVPLAPAKTVAATTTTPKPQPQPMLEKPTPRIAPAVATPGVEPRIGTPVMHTNNPPSSEAAATTPAPPTNGSASAYAAPPPMAMPADGVDAVMAAHHQFMARFIDVHKSIMLAYLQGGVVESSSAPAAYTPSALPAPPMAPPQPAPQPAQPAPVLAAPPAPRPSAAVEAAHVHSHGNGNGQASAAAPSVAVAPPPPAPPAPPAESSAPASGPLTKETLLQHLLRVVSDRTGYPPDMLGLDMDLEADLGIDSIKRIEILGTLQKEGILPLAEGGGDMEVLSKLNSLRAIADWFEQHAGEMTSSGAKPQPSVTAASNEVEDEAIEPAPRMRLEVADAPFRSAPVRFAPDGLVLITDDGAGVAAKLAEALRATGALARVVAIHGPDGDLADPVQAAAVVERIRAKHERVAALVHAAPLGIDPRTPADTAAWEQGFRAALHSLFNLVKLLERELTEARGRLLVATRMGGKFLVDASAPAEGWVGCGAVAGFAKTLAREWAQVRSSVVDFAVEADAESVAGALLTELGATDSLLEVGYCEGRRITLRPVPAALPGGPQALSLGPDSVILVTGGARGITAESARALAKRIGGGQFVLVGRSALPHEESPATAGITERKALKAALREVLERSGQKATPATIEATYKRLIADREIQDNLAAFAAAGARVQYAAVDVTDPQAFGAFLDAIYATHGRIDGVIHGAGVIEDKLLRDKPLDSLKRVMAPKVAGAAMLAAKLRPEQLAFLAFFTSVSGRYGNRGQCDYPAANEVLDKLAAQLNARWPGRVVAFNWGPWESSGGMVSAELAKQFEKAGVHVLSRREGAKAFVDELLFGSKRDAEIIFGGPLRLPDSAAPLPHPLLATNVLARRQDQHSLEIVRRLDPQQDLYLQDHRLDGRPVMPMAVGLELFAECAATLRPGLHLAAIRDHRVLRGISLEGKAEDLRITAKVTHEDERGAGIELNLGVGARPEVRYAAIAELVAELPQPPDVAPLALPDSQPLALSVSAAYQDWLFHGPIFAGIEEVYGVGAGGIQGRIAPSSPQRCLAESPETPWLIDPVVVDSGLQLIILWARTNLDMTPLPARLGSYRRFGGPFAGPVRTDCAIRRTPGNPNIVVEIRFHDAAGRLLGWIENLEATCSKALNRLAANRVEAS